jgi:hypothetical protein
LLPDTYKSNLIVVLMIVLIILLLFLEGVIYEYCKVTRDYVI